jgi:hypothetical protein
MRGKDNGRYPYRYLEMIENLFCYEPNTIEVCSNGVTATTKDDGCCFTVDINPMVCNAETHGVNTTKNNRKTYTLQFCCAGCAGG